jgi:uncharacterized membrane protein
MPSLEDDDDDRQQPRIHFYTVASSSLYPQMTSPVAANAVAKLSQSSSVRWAVSGWAFFIAENAILSENRTFLIEQLGGDDPYHWLYGTCSTLAMGSIGYSYYILRQRQKLFQQAAAASVVGSSSWIRQSAAMLASWTSTTLGLVLASQALPKLQVPVSLSSWQVRCPFDFAHARSNESQPLFGIERITRHPGLWSFGLLGLGQAGLQTHPYGLPMRIWWAGPAAVALLGGTHTDSRFRRNIGGSLDPVYDSMTSNVPFAATLMGRQGTVSSALQELGQELKPLNAAFAALAATAWVASRGRVRM